MSFPEGDAVVEVKGVTKSAAESHAAQLEKWVAGVFEETGNASKGILVANTWRNMPLAKRTKTDFPAQMLPYSESRGHTLVTGLQLFVIRAEVEAGQAKAEHWRKRLIEAVGLLEDVPDWRTVIEMTADEN